MMMKLKSKTLNIGYNLDEWYDFGRKVPITIDISPATNSHILICGMSGGGKSYFEQSLFYKLCQVEDKGEYHFADFKGDDNFQYLNNCPRYYMYTNSLAALDIVYNRLKARQSKEDLTRNPVTLIWDEYMANMLMLIGEDKKLATAVMNKVSEILLMGRSMAVRLIGSMQRPDAVAFPVGSRLNYGNIVIVGAVVKSIYEMLMPDFMEQVKSRQFGRGEGVVLMQGAELRFFKVGSIKDFDKVQQVCVKALS